MGGMKRAERNPEKKKVACGCWWLRFVAGLRPRCDDFMLLVQAWQRVRAEKEERVNSIYYLIFLILKITSIINDDLNVIV